MDKIQQLEADLNYQLNRLGHVLDKQGYPFKAGYLESFIGSLSGELKLTKTQMKLLAQTMMYRADRQILKSYG